MAQRKARSRMLALAHRKVGAVTAPIVVKAAGKEDALAREVLEEAAGYFAIWLGGMIDLLEPGVICSRRRIRQSHDVANQPHSSRLGGMGRKSAP